MNLNLGPSENREYQSLPVSLPGISYKRNIYLHFSEVEEFIHFFIFCKLDKQYLSKICMSHKYDGNRIS